MTAALTRWLASLLAMALYVATPHAQTPSTPAPPPPAPPSTQATQPVFKASTDVIVIDVGVTSDKGDVVSGLAQADFTLEVDGKPRRIVSAQFGTAHQRSRVVHLDRDRQRRPPRAVRLRPGGHPSRRRTRRRAGRGQL